MIKGYRQIGDVIKEIYVDLDEKGNPLLPPNSTIDPKPEEIPGYKLRIVNNKWEQVKVEESLYPVDYYRELKLDQFRVFREKVLDQPVEVFGRMFDGDETARTRLTQALVVYMGTGALPQAWYDADNQPYFITSPEELLTLVTTIGNAFAERFYGVNAIRDKILKAETKEELDAIVLPLDAESIDIKSLQ